MKYANLFSYWFLNGCVIGLSTWLSNNLRITLILYGWFVCSALLSLTLNEGIIATLLLGLYIDADAYSNLFGLSAYLMCATFVFLKQSGLRPTVLNCFFSFALFINLILQILFIGLNCLRQGISGHNLFLLWPQLLTSMLFLAICLHPLRSLQRYGFIEEL